jgi:hypothetical protein
VQRTLCAVRARLVPLSFALNTKSPAPIANRQRAIVANTSIQVSRNNRSAQRVQTNAKRVMSYFQGLVLANAMFVVERSAATINLLVLVATSRSAPIPIAGRP